MNKRILASLFLFAIFSFLVFSSVHTAIAAPVNQILPTATPLVTPTNEIPPILNTFNPGVWIMCLQGGLICLCFVVFLVLGGLLIASMVKK